MPLIKRSKKKRKGASLLGRTCVLRCLALYKGRQPYDIPHFIVVEVFDKKHVGLTDNGMRVFRVLLEDVLMA